MDYLLLWYAAGLIISYIGAKFIDPVDEIDGVDDLIAMLFLAIFGPIMIPIWVCILVKNKKELAEIEKEAELLIKSLDKRRSNFEF